MSFEIENIRKDIQMRGQTDSMMSSAWLLVYLLPIIAAFVWVAVFTVALISVIAASGIPPGGTIPPAQLAPVFASIALLYVFVIISFIANIILIYKLARRRNTHFKRQILLFEDIVAAAKTIAAKKGVNVEVTSASADRTLRETKAEETEKSAMLWAILSAVTGLAVFYVWYFLMKDFYKHEKREDAFWEDITRTLDKTDIKFSPPRRTETLPDRSFALYIIISLVTLGLFEIYWVYTLIKDPNQHFKYHTLIENQLLTTLETTPA